MGRPGAGQALLDDVNNDLKERQGPRGRVGAGERWGQVTGGLAISASDVAGIAIAAAVIGLGLTILNLVAVGKIITKAGYSAWWILVVFMPVASWVVSVVILDRAANSPFNSATSASFEARSFVALWVVNGIGIVLPWIFFLVFAFSDWPVRRQLREQGRAGAGSPDTRLSPSFLAASPRPQSDPYVGAASQAPTPSFTSAPPYAPAASYPPVAPDAPYAPYASAVPGASTPPYATDAPPAPMVRPESATFFTSDPNPRTAPVSAQVTTPCPHCGAATRIGSPFCGSCGGWLTADDHAGASSDSAVSASHSSLHVDSLTVAAPDHGVGAVPVPAPASTPAMAAPPADHTGPRCPNCMGVNRATSVFCSHCGSRMTNTF